MKRTPRELNTDFCFAVNKKKTPRELNPAYDLAQQKIIYLKHATIILTRLAMLFINGSQILLQVTLKICP